MTNRPITPRATLFRVATLLIIFAAFAIRLYRLDAQGFEPDEGSSIQFAASGFSGIVDTASSTEPHPPLYYSFLRAWYEFAGTSEFSLRFPSVVANVLALACLMKLASLLRWRSAALFGGVLFALNPYQVWYSQEARMYPFVALFGVLALYWALRAYQEGRWRHLALYTCFMLLALYSHYYAIFLGVFVACLILVAALARRDRRLSAGRWIAAQGAVAVLFVPWLAFAHRISVDYTRFNGSAVSLAHEVREAVVQYSLGFSVPEGGGFVLSLGFLAIAAVGMYSALRLGSSPGLLRCALISGYLLAPLGLGLLVSAFRPMFFARYLMVSAPAFYLLLGLGVVGCYHKSPLLGIAPGVFLLTTQIFSLQNYFFDPAYAKTDFEETASYIEHHARPGDAVVLDGWSQAPQFWYYNTMRFKTELPDYLFPLENDEDWHQALQRLDSVMREHSGVWLVDHGVAAYDPERVVEHYLARNYYQAVFRRAGNNRVVYYVSGAPASLKPVPLDITVGDEVVLESLASDSQAGRAGDVVCLDLVWRALDTPSRDYAVSWRLLDNGGHVVVQRDSEPASGFSPTTEWSPGQQTTDRFGMVLPAVLPPGQYSLELVVYDKATGAACQLRRGEAVLPAGPLSLGTLEVLDAPPMTDLDDSAPSHRAHLAFGPLEVVGFDLAQSALAPGDQLTTRLYWRVPEAGDCDYEATMRLSGDQASGSESTSVTARFSASRVQGSRVLATYLDIPVSPRAATGSYHLSLLVDVEGGSGREIPRLAEVNVTSRERSFALPEVPHRVGATFDDCIELYGYDVEPPPESTLHGGQELHCTLYWRALAEMATSYKVFVHLEGEDGKVRGQADSVPLAGKAPTNGWMTGEVLKDHYSLVVPAALPPGQYRLVVGLYEPETGRRMALGDGSGDSLVLTVLQSST